MSMYSADSAQSTAVQVVGGIIAAIVLECIPDPGPDARGYGVAIVIAAVVAVGCVAALAFAQFRDNTDRVPWWWSVGALPAFITSVTLGFRMTEASAPWTFVAAGLGLLGMLGVLWLFFRLNRKPAENPPDDLG